MTQTWEQLTVLPTIIDCLKEQGILSPTAIQEQAIPMLLAGKDVIAHSQTGTGKTLAYIIPALQRIESASQSVQALVLAPTQELAMQIMQVAAEYAKPLNIRVQALIGGAAIKRQLDKLKLHPQLIVGTPGRIRELIVMRKLKLHDASLLIVDEVDQIFGLGSTSEVDAVLQSMKKDRQVAFFSATYPEAMKPLEQGWLKAPIRIAVKPEQRVSATIKHFFLVSDARDKVDTARRLIRLLDPKSALLFLNDTANISNWESKLGFEGFTVEAIYGDADKSKRASTLQRFRDGRCQLLLATDLAARGLDIPELPLVMNLDPAFDADHYVHRAGRTGRMGKPGMVISIVTQQELFIMDKFQKQLGISILHKVMVHGKLLDAAEVKKHERQRRTSMPAARAKPTGRAASPKLKEAASTRERERQRKNKGAPKWLKAKRNSGSSE